MKILVLKIAKEGTESNKITRKFKAANWQYWLKRREYLGQLHLNYTPPLHFENTWANCISPIRLPCTLRILGPTASQLYASPAL